MPGASMVSLDWSGAAVGDTPPNTGNAEFAMDWSSLADGAVPTEPALSVLEGNLYQAPTDVVVSLTNLPPDGEVEFSIDDSPVATRVADSAGNLVSVSIPVSETLGTVGEHTLTASAAGRAASATFTVEKAPMPPLTNRGPDAAPAVASTDHRWILQDPLPGGLGSYIFPVNPTSWVEPRFERVFSTKHTTAQTGQFHVSEGYPAVTQFSFNGVCPTQAMLDALAAWAALNRRFYLVDHRDRAWIVTFLGLDARPRRRTNYGGTQTDWFHDYTVTAECFDQVPVSVA